MLNNFYFFHNNSRKKLDKNKMCDMITIEALNSFVKFNIFRGGVFYEWI